MSAPASTGYLALCVVGVWLTWSLHDYLQERIFRVPGFHFGFFMAFLLQFVSFVLSLVHQTIEWLFRRVGEASRRAAEEKELEDQRRHEEALDEEQGDSLLKEEEADAPWTPSASTPSGPAVAAPVRPPRVEATWGTLALYLALSLLIAAANGCATAALNYVSMQVKVLFKSGKIVTVMSIGVLCFGRHYALAEYAYMLLVVAGLYAFLLANSIGSEINASLIGVALLSLAVLSDSLVPNVQQKLLATRPKQELIFHTNWVSALITFCYILATGEAASAAAFLSRRPRVIVLMLLQALAGYFGIVVYLETVRSFGSKVTVIVTSCRKLFTIALSSLAFAHPLTAYHLVGVLSVFLGVLLNANHERVCSRWLVLPALLLTASVVAIQLHLDDAYPAISVALAPIREALLTRVV